MRAGRGMVPAGPPAAHPFLVARSRSRGMPNRFVLLLGLFVAGCEGMHVDAPDTGPDRPPTHADGGGLLDSGVPIDGSRRDAGTGAGSSGLCEVADCDPRRPDCESGSCVLWGEASTCEPAAGPYPAGTPCTTVMDCAAGLACFLTHAGGECGRICCPSQPDACTDGAVCRGSGVLVDGTATSWGRCLPPQSCEVLRAEESCEPREGCYIVDTSGATECRVAGTGGPGDPCVAQEDCADGFFCGFLKQCVRICRLGEGDCPPSEGRCIAQSHSPPGTGLCGMETSNARRSGGR